jgi:hypothetical protein
MADLFDTEACWVDLDEDVLCKALEELSRGWTPRRFALWGVDLEIEDVELLGYGLDMGAGVVVCGLDGTLRGRFASPESALRFFSLRGPARVIWLDPDWCD